MTDKLRHGADSLNSEAALLVSEVGARETVALLLGAASAVAQVHGMDANEFLGMLDRLEEISIVEDGDAT